ncbi:cytochrome b/b6 domain-containing protein [Vibrio parahaemolyticus]|uniref:cytochrome b/b6 domain-containing protein n=1 Tax=Vibrio parahaemolyticus TaxID=670 RepID=UPI002B217626|nr:cytochrome b/b6 domain-containing protein [Vibrio parahaemolyticus]
MKNNHVFYMEKEDGRENEQCNLKINDVFPLGYRIHEFSGEALLPFLLVLHLGASFMHHFIKQDGTLLRMLGKA